MPTYEFVCTACHKPFSIRTSVSEKNQVTCPYCGAESPRQVFSSCNLIKGSDGGGCEAPPKSGFG